MIRVHKARAYDNCLFSIGIYMREKNIKKDSLKECKGNKNNFWSVSDVI